MHVNLNAAPTLFLLQHELLEVCINYLVIIWGIDELYFYTIV